MEKLVKIEVKSLIKIFGRKTVLNNLSFDIQKGEIFGILGPNGAGKSTFISILATLCKPTSGDIFIDSLSVVKQSDKIKKSIGLVPQDIALYPTLSGIDNLKFWAGVYSLKGSLKKERIEEAISIVKLEARAKDRVSEYSGGMKRRLNIAVALLNHPEILVLDEPTVGVDIQSRKYIFDAIKALKDEGRTVIFTSHNIDEMEALCDRIAIMNEGKIIVIGPVNELVSNHGNLQDYYLKIME